MLGRARLSMIPRLDGVQVVGGPEAWVGRRFPWASVGMRGPRVQLLGAGGLPIIGLWTSWASGRAAGIARRASERSLRRELAAGVLDRVYVTESPIPVRVVLGVCASLTVLCAVGAVLPAFGA